VNWIYQIIKALLDWLRETPPPSISLGKAPPDLQKELNAAIDAARAGVSDKGDPRP
jgi:hypothetical protein